MSDDQGYLVFQKHAYLACRDLWCQGGKLAHMGHWLTRLLAMRQGSGTT